MKIGFKIDHEDFIEVVQGEDREFTIRVYDEETRDPINLSDMDGLKLDLRGSGGEKVTLVTDDIAFSAAGISISENTLELESHGLAHNETLEVQGSDLPSGLSTGVKYFVKLVDEDTIQFSLTKDGDAVDLVDAGSGSMNFARPSSVYFSDVELQAQGKITVRLDDGLTSNLKPEERMTPELSWDEGVNTRIVQLAKGLTVKEQVL